MGAIFIITAPNVTSSELLTEVRPNLFYVSYIQVNMFEISLEQSLVKSSCFYKDNKTLKQWVFEHQDDAQSRESSKCDEAGHERVWHGHTAASGWEVAGVEATRETEACSRRCLSDRQSHSSVRVKDLPDA